MSSRNTIVTLPTASTWAKWRMSGPGRNKRCTVHVCIPLYTHVAGEVENWSFCIAICFEHLSYMKAVTSHWFDFCKVIKDLGFTIAQKTVDELVYEVRANDCWPKFQGKNFHVFSFRFIWYNNAMIYYRYMICIYVYIYTIMSINKLQIFVVLSHKRSCQLSCFGNTPQTFEMSLVRPEYVVTFCIEQKIPALTTTASFISCRFWTKMMALMQRTSMTGGGWVSSSLAWMLSSKWMHRVKTKLSTQFLSYLFGELLEVVIPLRFS